MKTTDEQVRAFANIAASRDGDLLKAWLDTAQMESDAACRSEEGAKLHRAQGASTFILALKKALEDARQRMKLVH